jgi:hypothetical protein
MRVAAVREEVVDRLDAALEPEEPHDHVAHRLVAVHQMAHRPIDVARRDPGVGLILARPPPVDHRDQQVLLRTELAMHRLRLTPATAATASMVTSS